MQPEDFFAQFDVSRETAQKLMTYHKLLLKWQKAINLVGPKTLQQAWHRHFADSAQLIPHIPEGTKTIVDLGSGAGFPGLILGIMKPELSVHAIESDERKAQFIRTVSRETAVDVSVHNERIESVQLDFVPDLVTARALASLSQLLAFCLPWAEQNPDLKMVFLKGEAAQDEISAARALYQFACEPVPSITEPAARLLLISALKPI